MCEFLSGHVVTRKGKDYGKVLVITGVHHEEDRKDKRVSKYNEDLAAWESKNLQDVEFTHSCGKEIKDNELIYLKDQVKEYLKDIKQVAYDLKDSGDALDLSSRYGHTEIVKYLIQFKAPCSKWALNWVSNNGHIEIVKMLIEYKAPCDNFALNWASENGHTEIVKMLIEYGAPCTEDALDWASYYGRTEIVKMLKNYLKKL